ncbi:MAG: ABC transporter ATP-binding protein [Candidatus Kapabacteria bacterium]|nr:ABC transporter ATP-binding protein [Candidatus Kapabacteria bacterium]
MKSLLALLPYLKKYKVRLLWGFVFVTMANAASSFIPRVVGTAIDALGTPGFTMSTVFYYSLGVIGLTILSGVSMYMTRQTIIVTSRLVEYDLKNDFVEAIERQTATFFSNNSTGSLMALSTNDIASVREFLGPAIMYSANTIASFLFVLTLMLMVSPMLTLYALLPLPIIALTTYFVGQKVHLMYKIVQEQYSNLTTTAQESFSGAKVIRAYSRSDYESDVFAQESKKYVRQRLRLASWQSSTMPLMIILIGFAQIITLWYGGGLVIKGEATLGTLTQFFIYIAQLIWPIAAVGWVTNLIQRGAASMERLTNVIHQKVDIQSLENATKTIQLGKIEFENVSLQYSPAMPKVLSNVTLTIPAGSSLGIVGAVGSGKSSFISLIPRLYDVTTGEIRIDGVPLKQYDVEALREQIGVVQQEPFLFSSTIADNIGMGGVGQYDLPTVQLASQQAQLHNDVLRFPEQYDTILGERGITLSGGQRQRTAIARALIRNPKILIFDDSLSAVDTQTEEQILKMLEEVKKERTTIIISHRISAVKLTDTIVVLDKGVIVEHGTHEELLELNGMYATMYTQQLLEEELDTY